MKQFLLKTSILLAFSSASITAAPQFSGVIEVEAGHTDNSDTLELATFELGIKSNVSDSVLAEGLIALDDDGKMELDTATITFGNPEETYFRAGLMTLPFGSYNTNMISDPLTIMGETGSTTLQVGTKKGGFSGSAFAFKSDNKTRFGLNLDLSQDNKYNAGLSYINRLSEADGFEGVDTNNENVAGISAYASSKLGAFGLSAEYLSASSKFKSGDLINKKPSTTNIEASYDFALGGKNLTAAIGHQTSKQANRLGIAKTRNVAALSIELRENTSLSFEYLNDKDYAGENDRAITALLAVEF